MLPSGWLVTVREKTGRIIERETTLWILFVSRVLFKSTVTNSYWWGQKPSFPDWGSQNGIFFLSIYLKYTFTDWKDLLQ